MKKIIVARGREFVCRFYADLGGKMCEVSVSEIVRPTWRIFRCKYRSGYTFWVEDYSTILEGVEKAVYRYLAEEDRENKLIKLWSEVK